MPNEINKLFAKYSTPQSTEGEAVIVSHSPAGPVLSAEPQASKTIGRAREYMPSGYSGLLGIGSRCADQEAGADRLEHMLQLYPFHVYLVWEGGCGFGFSQRWARDHWSKVQEFHNLFWSEAGDVYIERHRKHLTVVEHRDDGQLRRCAHA